MGDENPDVTVAVTTDTEPDAAPVVEPSDTVVVTPPGPDHTNILVGMSTLVGAMAERMARIEEAVGTAQVTAEEAATGAAVAQMEAADAQTAAIDSAIATEQAIEEAKPEPVEEPPAKTHWLDRSFSEWKGGRKRR